jgi:hypothetical protein
MRQTPRFITAIALLAIMSGLGLAACNSEPTCEKAADRVLELIDEQNEKMLAKFPESQRKQLAEITAKSLPRDRLVKDCQARFTKEQIACTIAAKSLEDASKCNQAAAPTGVAPAPADVAPAPGAAPGQPEPGAAPAQPAEGATPGTEGAGAPAAAPQAPAAPAQPAQPQ